MIPKLLGEFLGTMMLIYLGDSVVANHNLKRNNAKGIGVLAIDLVWGAAVAIPAFIFMGVSGAFFNPAVVIGYLLRGSIDIVTAILYIIFEIMGAFAGSALMYVTFLDQFAGTEDQGVKLACFTTRPAYKHYIANFLTEFVGTFFLVYAVFEIVELPVANIIKANMIGMMVFGLAACMGGPTGASLNPARDIGPRIAHTVLPVAGKGSSEWDYGWCPPLAQICSAIAAFIVYSLVHLAY